MELLRSSTIVRIVKYIKTCMVVMQTWICMMTVSLPLVIVLNRVCKRKNSKIEYGSGPVRGRNRSGYLTIDSCTGCDLIWDLRLPLPLRSGSVEKIYSSHFLEHLSESQLIKHLTHSYRLLKDQGQYLVAVPDASIYLNAYTQGVLSPAMRLAYKPYMMNSGNLIDQVNYIAYMGGEHKILLDRNNLLTYFKIAGFNSITERSYISGLDHPERHFESIYILAVK